MAFDVTVDQAVSDKMFETIYNDEASPAEIWDAIGEAMPAAVDVAEKGCRDGTYIGPVGQVHFGTAILGHLYHSTVLDRVQNILNDPTYDPGSKVAYAIDFMNESWEVVNARIAELEKERDARGSHSYGI